MACVESLEIVNEIIFENGCPTKQKVAKHCTKNTFGRKKRVINAQQLRAARKCRYPASKPVTATGAIGIALSASATPRSTTSIDYDGGCPLQSASSSKLALLKAASDQEDLVPSDETNGK